MVKHTPTLALLNENDDPKNFTGGWIEDEEDGTVQTVQWDADIEGWNYTRDYALD